MATLKMYMLLQETTMHVDQILKKDQEAVNQFAQNHIGQLTKVLPERPQDVLPSNTVPNPREDIKVITTQSSITLVGSSVPPPRPLSSFKKVERDPKTITDQVHISCPKSTARVPPSVVQPSPASTSSMIPERNPHQP
nr:hypothetical protein [Tanacetum cinerariifolium]